VFDLERQVLARGVCYKAFEVRPEPEVRPVSKVEPETIPDRPQDQNTQDQSTQDAPCMEGNPPHLEGDQMRGSSDEGKTQTAEKRTEEQLCWDIDQVLEPAEVTESIALEDVLLAAAASHSPQPSSAQSADLAGLPPQVASVFQAVFDQDFDEADVPTAAGCCNAASHTASHLILSNPVAIDLVLNRIMQGKGQVCTQTERSQLKVEVERGVRRMVSQFLARREPDHHNN